ncbi:FAD-dependent oxidoreductase [Paenibacillus sp. IB182496]|uniref:FAD-dependent oxidoreductase n=1 Tax=Paenibacillus sabuli TaxID=2772509 RepID=A0A927C0E6_9BACL|nr:FAD-dependent oxidoreductase [Paenibacillus sabuli]MBD2848603.1 FAD-dependent oxidoreductase [Paenibacillus sabuli]
MSEPFAAVHHLTAHLPLNAAATYDVIVCGGGAAGVVAAIQAARLGARVALIEKTGMLGGTAVTAAVDFPGLFHAWTKQVIAGIGWELIEETAARGGAELPDFEVQYPHRRHWMHQIRVNRFVYSTVMDELCVGAGVDLHLHALPIRVEQDEEGCTVILGGKDGLQALRTRKLVDATGDANAAILLGYACEESPVQQPGTLIYALDGYRLEDVDQQALLQHYREAAAVGEIRITDHRPADLPLWSELKTRGGSANHIPAPGAASSTGRTRAELEARRSLLRVRSLLRRVPGLESLQVSFFAPECGIRETRRIVGEQTVTVDRYTSGYVWPDAICYSFYPIDVHSDRDGTIDVRPLQPGVVPTLPYGALVPRGSDHLLVAGRCIAGDREANSAYRVQASCMATGQAAGAASALAAAEGVSVREVPLAALRAALAAHRAIVPPA